MNRYAGTVADGLLMSVAGALVQVLRRNRIRTTKAETIKPLDAHTVLRLVGYNDYDPCEPPLADGAGLTTRQRGAAALGVTIKAENAVGDCGILILKAQQPDGLITFVTQEGVQAA